jgi:hypothetical protein
VQSAEFYSRYNDGKGERRKEKGWMTRSRNLSTSHFRGGFLICFLEILRSEPAREEYFDWINISDKNQR